VRAPTYLLCEFTEWVCRTYGGSVTSWWRSPARNRLKGGVRDSLHQQGDAVDVVYDGDPPAIAELVAVAKAYFVEVIREPDHDHFESTLAHLHLGRGAT
jgi:hypothetical protein